MIIELDVETENIITALTNQEKTSAAQLIKKALVNYFESTGTTSTQGNIMDFAGILKDSPSFQGDPLDIQKAMRDEWDLWQAEQHRVRL